MTLAAFGPRKRPVGKFWKSGAGALILAWTALAVPMDAKAQVRWSQPAVITEAEVAVHSSAPRVATDGFQFEGVENWMAVWTSSLDDIGSGPTVIQASRSRTNGDTWEPPQYLYLNSEETEAPFPIDENLPSSRNPDIAAGRNGIYIAVWESETTSGETLDKSDIGFAVYNSNTDEGFQLPGQVLTGSMLNSEESQDTSSDFVPRIATDHNNRWIVVWRSVDVDSEGMEVVRLKSATSSNNGRDWSEPVIIASDVHPDAEPVVASNEAGYWVVVWSDLNPAEDLPDDDTTGTLDIFAAWSDDQGLTWSAPAPIRADANDNVPDLRPRVIRTPAGEFLVAWTRIIGDTQHLMFSRASEPDTWTNEGFLLTNVRSADIYDLSLATDARNNILAMWGTSVGTDREIRFSRSTDSGLTWTPPQLLASTPGVVFSEPALASDYKGKWVAVYGTSQPGMPYYSTSLIPIPEQEYSDIRVVSASLIQPPTEEEHPLFAQLPVYVTVTVKNDGPDPAVNALVWLWMLSGEMDPTSATTDRTFFTQTDAETRSPWVTYEVALVDPVMPGESVDVTFEVMPRAIAEGSEIRQLLATTYCRYDTNLLNNELLLENEFFPRPPLADLSTTLESYPQPKEGVGNGGHVNQPMALIVKVTNNGAETARSVLVDEILEELVGGTSAFTFNYAACTQGSWSYERMADGRGRILCNFGDIPVYKTATLVIAITPRQIGIFGHNARARSIGLRSFDLTPEDASAAGSFKVTHERLADIGVELSVDRQSILSKETVKYTAVVTNHGDPTGKTTGMAYHPRVILTLPAGAEVRSVRLPHGNFNRATNAVICALKKLPQGASATLEVEAVLRQAGSATATAVVSNFGARDTKAANDTAQVTVQVAAALPASDTGGQVLSAGTALPRVLLLGSDSDSQDTEKKKAKRRKAERRARKSGLQTQAENR